LSPAKLAENLERNRVVGWIDTQVHDVHRKIRMLVAGDPGTTFGLGDLLPATTDEVFEGLNRLADWDFLEQANGSGGKSFVSPAATVSYIEAAAERLRAACERGERVFFGTGHPTGPLELYARLAQAMGKRGAEVVRFAEGDSYEGYINGAQVRYVCDVACVSMSGDLVHTHSPRAMEFLLGNGLRAELVVGDHGFTGAALARSIDAVAVVDTNDPALVLAWSRGLNVVPILCDDNRPAAAYDALARFVIDRL
jgi:hypothetical protein